ncbi:type II secretion system major pseudopilin GspG [bacterium]|nr:type II secretion system major pseudopilin GspG [bacterium]
MSFVKLRRALPTRGPAGFGAGGFTLLEIMVVVIIIGTIAGLVGVRVLDRLEESRVQTAKAQMASIKSALDMFKMDNGFYPPGDIGIAALVSGDKFGGKAYLNSDTPPLDPWGMPYGYASDGQTYAVWSGGPDRTPNTQDDVPG